MNMMFLLRPIDPPRESCRPVKRDVAPDAAPPVRAAPPVEAGTIRQSFMKRSIGRVTRYGIPYTAARHPRGVCDNLAEVKAPAGFTPRYGERAAL